MHWLVALVSIYISCVCVCVLEQAAMDSSVMPPSSLGNSTAWSRQVYYKRTPRKGYVQYWGVLLHRSVSDPYRIELYEKSEEASPAPPPNQTPQFVIDLENVLCIKPLEGKGKGKSRKYEFQIITVSNKHQFATKEAEGCRAWVKKLNRQLFGPPEAGVLYEYRVRIVPTAYSGNLGLQGNYIMRISDTTLLLCTANGILPTHFQCSLSNVSQAHHLKVSEHGKKQSILIVRTCKGAEIGEGGYAFYADTASEIASIIEHRRKSLHSHKGEKEGPTQAPLSPGDVDSLLGGHALRLHTSGSDITSLKQQAIRASHMPCVQEDPRASPLDTTRHSRKVSADSSTQQSSLGIALKQSYSDSKLRKETASSPKNAVPDLPPLPPPRASSLTSPTSPQFHPGLRSLPSPISLLSPQFHHRTSSLVSPISPLNPSLRHPESTGPTSLPFPSSILDPAYSPPTPPRHSNLSSSMVEPSMLSSLHSIRPRSATTKTVPLNTSHAPLQSKESVDSDFEAVSTWLLNRPNSNGSLSSPGHDDTQSQNENNESDNRLTDRHVTVLERQQMIEQETLQAGYLKVVHSKSNTLVSGSRTLDFTSRTLDSSSRTLDSKMRSQRGKKQPRKSKKILLRRVSSVDLGLNETETTRTVRNHKALSAEEGGCNKSVEDLTLATPEGNPPDFIDRENTPSDDEISPYAVLDGFLLNEIDARPPAILPRREDFTPVEEVGKQLCQGLDGKAIREVNAKETVDESDSDWEELCSEADESDSDVEGGYIKLVNQGQYLASESSDDQ